MGLEKIKDVLMNRDKLTENEAQELIDFAKADLVKCIEHDDTKGAEDVCYYYLGLESDYLDELINDLY
jgi:hypothetical protein